MILSDQEILKHIKNGNIVIDPFQLDSLGSNSYDVHLSSYLACYKNEVLDAFMDNQVEHFDIPRAGFIIKPGQLYLGSTLEYTETHSFVPFLEGKSSVGRLGIDIHATAGKGDVGFCNYWTLEISCTQPVRIYAGMPIGQLIYYMVKGDIKNNYLNKVGAKYTNKSARPVSSLMWKNFSASSKN